MIRWHNFRLFFILTIAVFGLSTVLFGQTAYGNALVVSTATPNQKALANTATKEAVNLARTATATAVQATGTQKVLDRTATALSVQKTRTQQAIFKTATPAAKTATSVAATQTFIDTYKAVTTVDLEKVFSAPKQPVMIQGWYFDSFTVPVTDHTTNTQYNGYFLMVYVDSTKDVDVRWTISIGADKVRMTNDNVVAVFVKALPARVSRKSAVTVYGQSQQSKLDIPVTVGTGLRANLEVWSMQGDVVTRLAPTPTMTRTPTATPIK